MRRALSLRPILIGLMLTAAAAGSAAARDFEMGGDSQYPYSLMRPAPSAAPYHHPGLSAVHRERAARHSATPMAQQDTSRQYHRLHGSSGAVRP
jgi:hypothetical protein